jgi:RNA polymerase sigma-70 factor (ECF subfamily)
MKYLKNEEEARDVVQQVFEKAIEEIGKYKIDHFGGWIYRIAINQCLMKLRKKGAVSVELTERMEFTQQEDAEEWLMQKEQKLDSMHEALQTLPEEQRICIERFYLKGQSYRIIGEETGYTILQIKSFIQNGKRKLKILLHSKKEV